MAKVSGKYVAKELSRRKSKVPTIIGDDSPDYIIKRPTPPRRKRRPGYNTPGGKVYI